MTNITLQGERLKRDIDGISADVIVSGTRIHAWNRGRHGALTRQKMETKATRMAAVALQRAGANRDERWLVTLTGDDVTGSVSAERADGVR